MIGTKCESHGLYHLWTSGHVSSVVDFSSLSHAQLDHPSLAKLQKVPSLSRLSTLSCKLCHLGKHSYSPFPKSVSNKALSVLLWFTHI